MGLALVLHNAVRTTTRLLTPPAPTQTPPRAPLRWRRPVAGALNCSIVILLFPNNEAKWKQNPLMQHE